jgi:hypothetical protein
MARRKSNKSIFTIMSEPSTKAPGLYSRMEVATGLLVRSIRVNGASLLVESFDVQPKQDIEVKWFVQGGPRASISDIGKKWVEGQIVFPLRAERDGTVSSAIRTILRNAELPNSSISLDTNHTLSYLGITAENGGSDSNELLSLNDVIVKSLTISASADSEVKITVQFFGRINSRVPGDYITPPNIALGRTITWADCDASRFGSAMRTVSLLEFTIENTVEDITFLTAYGDARSDQIATFGVKQCKWSGRYEEVQRLGVETENYFHGGWKVGENIIFDFGIVKFYTRVPLFQISEQPLSAKMIVRKSKFITITSPNQTNPQGKLIYFPEEEI